MTGGKQQGTQGTFARHDHAHLKLTRAVNPQPRRKQKPRGPAARYPDPAAHASALRDQTTEIRLKYRRRASVLGINPDLLLMFELNRPIDQDDIGNRGLDVLEATDEHAMVAFASDPELTVFLRDLNHYASGPPPGQKSVPLQKVFDAIDTVRMIEPDDVIDQDLREHLKVCGPDHMVRVDVECWCPEDEPAARGRYDGMAVLIATIGIIVDQSFRHRVGMSIIRADVNAEQVRRLADTTRVRRISRLPRSILSTTEVHRAGLDTMPHVLEPDRDAPIVAVVDSGVRGGHPLLRPALRERLAVGSLDPHSDDSGHGTLVAGLTLYGSLEQSINHREAVRPAGLLVSIRVLDGDCSFPEDRLWQEDLIQAITLAAECGARVVNLSLGDDRHPYQPPAPLPVAAAIDELARAHDMVVVVSTGNVAPHVLPVAPEIVTEYPRWLLGLIDLQPAAQAGLAPPSMAALALTVGATVGAPSQGARTVRPSVDQTPIGQPGEVSPLSRIGPGIERGIKPELAAPGGSYWLDGAWGRDRIHTAPDSSVVGPGGTQPDQLLAYDAGTSFAAPIVSHAALRVLGHYPQLSANAVRALVLGSVTAAREVLTSDTKTAELAKRHRQLTGFGMVDAERAEFSSDYRAVLLADARIPIDAVHLYSVPIPRAFFDSGKKSVRVALAHDPQVRATRVKYLSNRMSVFAFRGIAIEEVRRRFAAYEGADEQGVPKFPSRYKIELKPSNSDRYRGANQLGVHHFTQRWPDYLCGGDIILAVRCTGRWPTGETAQGYALAVVLETDGSGNELYGELRAQLPLLTEIEGEIEIG
jgi:Subtilase family